MNKLILLFLLIVGSQCKPDIKQNNIFKNGNTSHVDSIVVIDRTILQRNFGDFVISDPKTINKIVVQLNKLNPIEDSSFYTGKQPILSNSFGFLEVNFYSQGKVSDHIAVYYTTYNGVAFTRDFNHVFKNDKLEMALVEAFQQIKR